MAAGQTNIDEAATLTLSTNQKTNLFEHVFEESDAAGMLSISIIARRVSDGMMKMFHGMVCYYIVAGAPVICGMNNMQTIGTPQELADFSDIKADCEMQSGNFCIAVTSMDAVEFDWACSVKGFSANHVVE